MGFSIKVAPGVRVRASSRGIRTSMGPRAARIHMGGGRAGFSTGAGPVGYYTSLSTGSRGSSASRRPSPGESQRALAQADKLEQAEELQHALLGLLNLHRHEFAQAMPPRAPEPPQVDTAAVLKDHEKVALQGLSVFKRDARKQARAAATASAQRETAQLEAQRREQWTQHQQQLDQWWKALVGNDPEVVLSTLTAAFEDNEAPAAAVGIDGADVALVTLVPTIDTLPDRKPATTPAGNLTLKRLTKKERGTLHNAVVASHVLLTARETFAVAPSLSFARIIALQHTGNDAFGRPRIDVLLATRFDREGLSRVLWNEADAIDIVQDASTELLANIRKATSELQPLALTNEPELTALLAQVEVDELVSAGQG